jgi:hypothetical protein
VEARTADGEIVTRQVEIEVHGSDQGGVIIAPEPGVPTIPPQLAPQISPQAALPTQNEEAVMAETAVVTVDLAPAPPSEEGAGSGTAGVADYLQFADTTGAAAPAEGSGAATDPLLGDYLAVAGVTADKIAVDTARLPPTEVLLDALSAADEGAVSDQPVVDDAALAAIPVEVPQQPQDDPQHHGV